MQEDPWEMGLIDHNMVHWDSEALRQLVPLLGTGQDARWCEWIPDQGRQERKQDKCWHDRSDEDKKAENSSVVVAHLER